MARFVRENYHHVRGQREIYMYHLLRIPVYLFLIKHCYYKTSFVDVTDQIFRNFPKLKKPAPSKTGINNYVLNEQCSLYCVINHLFLTIKATLIHIGWY